MSKKMYNANYQYKVKGSERYVYFEELIIKTNDSQKIHDYLEKKRQELNKDGYDMEYSYSKIDDKRILEL